MPSAVEGGSRTGVESARSDGCRADTPFPSERRRPPASRRSRGRHAPSLRAATPERRRDRLFSDLARTRVAAGEVRVDDPAAVAHAPRVATTRQKGATHDPCGLEGGGGLRG